jgi:hypothetical protein
MVTLPPEQQLESVRDYPGALEPESGAWGRSGYTRVRLSAIDADTLGEAMTLAWQNPAATRAASKRKSLKRR